MNDIPTIGSRIRQVRNQRGLKQWQLAERAAISAVYLSDIERGAKRPSIDVIYSLARALGTEPGWLLDRRERLEKDGTDDGIIGVRDTMLAMEDIPGLDAGGGGGTALPVSVLERHVDDGWDAYWAGRLGWLSAWLPRMIRNARATEREARGEQAQAGARRALAQTYQLTGCWLVHMGADDLAFAAARRGIISAGESGDDLQRAVLLGTLSWVCLHQGRLSMAEAVAVQAADQIRPSGRVPIAHRTVYGALLLSALAPAAAAGNPDAAAGYLEAARVETMWFTGGDRHDYRTNMGPTQVAMQRTYAWAVLHEPGRALEASRLVRRADLLPISWGAHHLDIALACLDKNRDKAASARRAIRALCTALDVSRDWAQHQGLWRELVAAAVEAETRKSDGARKLAKAAGLQ